MIISLKQFIEAIQDTTKDDLNYFYRGQCNNYQPLPSAFRDNFMQKEDYLYHELILRCPEHFSGLPHLDTLVMMQHYGLPTRLLDVTTNPLVALYFACKDYRGSHGDEPGKLYVYGVTDDKVAYSDSDRVLMLSCIPIFKTADKDKILEWVNDAIANGGVKKNTNGSYPAATERLFHEIAKEVPAFKREIKPVDLISPIVVKPMRANARILKQDGAFIISGLCKDKEDAETRIHAMCRDELEIGNRNQILQELDSFGINEASLFPEVDKVATYLKEKS